MIRQRSHRRRVKRNSAPAIVRVETVEPRLLLSADGSIFANVEPGATLTPGPQFFLDAGSNDAFDYEFYRTVDDQESLFTTVDDTVGPFTVNLDPGEYRVRSRVSPNGAWFEMCFSVSTGAGPVITSPASGSDFTSHLSVAWDSVANAASYELELFVYNGHQTESVETFTGITGTSLTIQDSTLLAGRRYAVFVRAILPDGPTSWSSVDQLSDITSNLRDVVDARLQIDNDQNVSVRVDTQYSRPEGSTEVELYFNPVGDRSTPTFRQRTDLPASGALQIPHQFENGDYELWTRLHFADGTFSRWGQPEVYTISDANVDATPSLLTPNYQGNYDITQTRFDLTWTQSILDDSYEVWIAPHDDLGNPVVNVTGITETKYQTADLPSDIYTIQVRAKLTNGGTSGWSEPRIFAVHPDGFDPIAITGGVGQQDDTTPLIEWTPIGNVDNGYELFIARSDSPSTPVYRRTGLQGSSHEIETPLEEGFEYRVWVRAGFDILYVGQWNTPWGDPSALNIGAPADSQDPVAFTQGTVDPNDRTPSLTWDARQNVLEYEVWIGSKGNRTSAVYHRRGITGTTHDVETELPDDTVFEGWIRAHYTNGVKTRWGAPTEFVIGTPASGPSLDHLTFLAGLDDSTDATPELSWDDPGNVARFDLYINEVGDRGTAVYRRNVQSSSHVVQVPLQENTNYEFWVRAIYNTGEQTRWGQPTVFTTTTFSADFDQQVPSVQLTDNGVSWSAISEAVRYHVEVTEYFDSVDRGRQSHIVYSEAVTGTSVALDLDNGEYDVTVQGENAVGVRTQVSPRLDFTIAVQAVQPVLNVSGNVASWDAVPFATAYTLWVNEYDSNGALVRARAILTTTSALSASMDLTAGTYRGWLQAAVGTQQSQWSAPVEFVIS